MDLAEIKKYLDENKDKDEVKIFIAGLNPLDLERVKEYADKQEDGKKWLQSYTDNKVTKGIDTFKEKTLPGLIEAEKEKIRVELNPEETEEQKKLRKLEGDLEIEKKARLKTELLNLAIKRADEKNLPKTFLDRFIGEDETSTIKNLDLLEIEYNKALKDAVEIRFKDSGRDPHKTKDTDGSYYTQEQMKGMSLTEIQANLEKVNQSLGRN